MRVGARPRPRVIASEVFSPREGGGSNPGHTESWIASSPFGLLAMTYRVGTRLRRLAHPTTAPSAKELPRGRGDGGGHNPGAVIAGVTGGSPSDQHSNTSSPFCPAAAIPDEPLGNFPQSAIPKRQEQNQSPDGCVAIGWSDIHGTAA